MNPEQQALLKKYSDAVVQAPKHFHLTSEKDHKTFFERHVMDAVKIHELLPPSVKGVEQKVADVGTGNGVPGVVLAILEPSWHESLIDSDNKKCGFLESFCKNSAIKNVSIFSTRVEELGHGPLRASFSIVFARALGKLAMTLELISPLTKEKGLVIVPHGTSWTEEWSKSHLAAKELGLDLIEVKPYKIMGNSFQLVFFCQKKLTPTKYPRRFAQIKKKPL